MVGQVAHIVLTDYVWEEDAFERARLGLREAFDAAVKGGLAVLMSLLTGLTMFLLQVSIPPVWKG